MSEQQQTTTGFHDKYSLKGFVGKGKFCSVLEANTIADIKYMFFVLFIE
jgi:hypothetical protein